MQQPGSRPPSAPVTGWRVTDQVPTTEQTPSGRAERGMRVSFMTGKGVSGSVFIPESQYTPDNVRAAIAAQAALIDQVHALQG